MGVAQVSATVVYQDNFEHGLSSWTKQGTNSNNIIGLADGHPAGWTYDYSLPIPCPGYLNDCSESSTGTNHYVYLSRESNGAPIIYKSFNTLGYTNIKSNYFIKTMISNLFLGVNRLDTGSDFGGWDTPLVVYRIGHSGNWTVGYQLIKVDVGLDIDIDWTNVTGPRYLGSAPNFSLDNQPEIQIGFTFSTPEDKWFPNSQEDYFIDDFQITGDPLPVCGNGQVESGEQCESPNSNNNHYCSESTEDCSGTKLGNRNSFGNCNSQCQCTQNSFTNYQCVKNKCGATCSSNSDCNDGNSSTIDTCNSNCGCVHVSINCSSNSGCGTNGLVNGLFCQNNNVFQNFITYTCHNAGTIQSYCSNSTSGQLQQTCLQNQICSNGICVNQSIICNNNLDCDDNNPYTQDQCINPRTPQSYCNYTNITCINNSDCGINGVSNPFCNNNDVFTNQTIYTCINPNSTSSRCSNSTSSQKTFDCGSNSCGTYGTNYCKGDNVYHSRTCYNKGCSLSSCFNNSNINEELVKTCANTCDNGACIQFGCSQNSDCGTDGLIGSNYCSGNNVIKDYTTFTCNNPNTINSYCSNSNQSNTIQTCSYRCTNGACLTCVDKDKDGVCDPNDKCPNTPVGVDVDQNGCSQMQFCLMQPICGTGCDWADWKNNAPFGTKAHDCITVIVSKEGDYYPKCAALVGTGCGI